MSISGRDDLDIALAVREAALEDRRPIWEWWNDPVTRRMMKKNDYVPWDEHTAWFEKALVDPERILCVGLVDSQRIGVVRFDRDGEEVYEVSINLNPEFRGRGYAPRMLVAAIDYLRSIRRPKKLFATVKKTNIPSEKSFARAGFTFFSGLQRRYPRMAEFDGETEYYCEMDVDKTKSSALKKC